MEIKNLPISVIKPYPQNAKKHPEKQIKQIAKSIEKFGFNQPIVIDKKNYIIVGHGRLEAAQLLGLTEVPVLQIDLTENQAKAYRIADNKLNESEWDLHAVLYELEQINLVDAKLVELTGFDLPELQQIMIEEVENETNDETKQKADKIEITLLDDFKDKLITFLNEEQIEFKYKGEGK